MKMTNAPSRRVQQTAAALKRWLPAGGQWPSPVTWQGLALAVCLPAAAGLMEWMLWPWISPSIWIFVYPAVFLASRWTGFWGGIVSTILGAAMVWFIFIPLQASAMSLEFIPPWSTLSFVAMGYLFSDTHERLRRKHVRIESRFEAIFDQAAVGIGLVGLDGRFFLVNRKLCEMLGYSADELQAMSFQQITEPEDLTESLSHRQRLIDGEIQINGFEKRYIRADGEAFWVNITLSLGRKPNGEPDYIIAIVENIEKRKKIEAELRNKTAALDEAQRVSDFGTWWWDFRTGAGYYSDAVYEIYGRDPTLGPAGFQETQKYFTPESWSRLVAERAKCMAGGTRWECDLELARADGGPRWVTMRAEMERDSTGAVVRSYGSVQDITKRKKAELALIESEERMQLFIEHAPAALAMFDREMRYLSASHRWMDDYALDERDIIGRSHYDLFPEIPERWKEVHRRAQAGEVVRANEDKFVRKDGSIQWLRWEARPWRNASGAVGGIVIFAEDISGIVNARNEILRANAELEARVAARTAELDEARQKAELNNERLRMAVAAGAIGTLDIDLLHDTVVVDDNWRELYGFAPDSPVTTALIDRCIFPDDMPMVAEARRKAFDPRDGGSYRAQYRIRRPDSGAERWISSHAQVHFDDDRPVRVVGVARDITVERRLELSLHEKAQLAEQIKASEARLRAVIDGAGDAIITIDDTGVIQSINAAGVRMFGYERDEIIGRKVQLLTNEPIRSSHDGYIQNYLRTGVAKIIGVSREVEGRRKDGTLFPAELAISEAKFDKTRLFVGFMRDLSAQREAEANIERLRTERATAIGGIAVALAHEINQPFLASVAYLNTARQLLGKQTPQHFPAIEETLDLAANQIMRAGQIINHLREFASSGEPDKTFQHLHELIRNVGSLTEDSLKQADVELTLRLNAEPDRVLVDKVQIKQVLHNLIRNAKQAMSNSTTRKLTIATESIEDDMIRIDIIDTGCGLTQETMARLFEPFVTTKDYGMGVGLSISRSIIEAHYGKLWAEPNPDGGAIFSFTLPSATNGAADA